MLKLHSSWFWTLLYFLGGTAVFAQQAAPIPLVTPARRGRMQVLEFQAEPAPNSPVYYYTVVGAVETSAVYTSSKQPLPLSDLVSAAGGVTQDAVGAVRILRDGRPRPPMVSRPDDPLPVFPNEVVVVVPADPDPLQPQAAQFVPVVCLGLDARPIVLPLAQRVQSLPALLQQLYQPQELAPYVQVLHPSGRPSTGPLAAGSVLVFDPRTVNQNGLRNSRLHEDFPAPVDIESAGLPKISPAAPAINPAAAPAITPEGAGTNTSPGGEALAVNSAPRLPEPLDMAELFPIPAVEPQQPVTDTTTHAAPQTLAPAPPPPLEALPEPVLEPLVGQLRSGPTKRLVPVAKAERASWVYSDEPAATKASEASRPPVSEPEPTLAEADFPLQEINANPTVPGKKSSTGVWPVLIGIGIVLLACGSAGWFLIISQRELKAEEAASQPPSHPQVSHSAEQRTRLSQLLDPATPVIEVQLPTPAPSQLHGEPVGHRYLYVHERHQQLSGPRFGKGQGLPTHDRRSKDAALKLRHSLHETLTQQRSKSFASAKFPVLPPLTNEPAENEYDVVQPEPDPVAPRRAGTLERVLRSRQAKAANRVEIPSREQSR